MIFIHPKGPQPRSPFHQQEPRGDRVAMRANSEALPWEPVPEGHPESLVWKVAEILG